MKLWDVRWEGIFIGLARAVDAAAAIRLKQAQHPDIEGGAVDGGRGAVTARGGGRRIGAWMTTMKT